MGSASTAAAEADADAAARPLACQLCGLLGSPPTFAREAAMAPTPTETTYRVAYTEPMLRRAVGLFVWRSSGEILRRRGWLLLVAISLIGMGLASGWSTDPSWVLAVYIAATALVPLVFVLV